MLKFFIFGVSATGALGAESALSSRDLWAGDAYSENHGSYMYGTSITDSLLSVVSQKDTELTEADKNLKKEARLLRTKTNWDLLKSSQFATLIGGQKNKIFSSNYASIVGGKANKIVKSGYATVVGGFRNWIMASSPLSAIVGGSNNIIRENSKKSLAMGFMAEVKHPHSAVLGFSSETGWEKENGKKIARRCTSSDVGEIFFCTDKTELSTDEICINGECMGSGTEPVTPDDLASLLGMPEGSIDDWLEAALGDGDGSLKQANKQLAMMKTDVESVSDTMANMPVPTPINSNKVACRIICTTAFATAIDPESEDETTPCSGEEDKIHPAYGFCSDCEWC